MAVVCMSEAQKIAAAELYKQRFHSMDRLAEYFGRSSSTIRKVLLEQRVLKHKPVLSVEEGCMLRLLHKHKITPAKLEKLLGEDSQ